MRERIYQYLLAARRGVAAGQILRDVLSIQSPKAHSSDSILAGFLGQDPRFALIDGLWILSSPAGELIRFDFGQSVMLHLEIPNRSGTLRNFRAAARWPDGRIQDFTAPASSKILRRIRSDLQLHPLIVWSSWELRILNGLLQSKGLEAWRGVTLCLRNLAARVLKRTPSTLHREELAQELGVSPADEETPAEVIRCMYECFLILMDRVPAELSGNPDLLGKWIDRPEIVLDFRSFAFGPDFLRQLPDTPGVYLMKDSSGTVIYVGKSRNLKRRVSSYFTARALGFAKIARIHERLNSIEVHSTDNEVEALLLEMRLIKDFRPAVNMQTEIHERQADRLAGKNLLLFVVNAGHKGAKVYCFRNGIFAERQSVSLGRPPSKRLRERVQSLYFNQGRSKRRRGEIWEKEIIARWLTANQKRLNYLDVDEWKDFEVVLERLQNYLCDPDRLTCKVYYR